MKRYLVTVACSATEEIEVEAESEQEAMRKAECDADPISFEVEAMDCECLDGDTDCVSADALLQNRSRLTGIEEAFWAITGKIPPEAIQRLQQEQWQEATA